MGPREWSPRFKCKTIPFEFPHMVALVDNKKDEAYEIEFAREVDIHQFTEIRACRDITILSHFHECAISDALMVVRPWVRIGPLVSELEVDILRTSRYTLIYDDAESRQESVEKILIGSDGRWIWKHAYKMPMGKGYPFDAAPMDNERKAAVGWKRFGNFIANGTKIEMRLSIEGEFESPVFLYSGLVAAHYTTHLT